MSAKTIKVRMKALGCSPEGHYREGEVHDLPAELASQLLDARQAERVDEDEAGPECEPEAEPEAEVAAVRAKGKRG